MTATHTPGPWEWAIHDYSVATLCGPNSVGEHDGMEAHVLSVSPCKGCTDRADPKEWKWGRCTTANEADARLIAAAPDLLAALKAFNSHDPTLEQILFGGMPDDAMATLTLKLGVLRRATAAVAKAEGHPVNAAAPA
jgi:hypothetical protein